ncbi:MAG: thymidine phosphorylase [Calditrichaeota bacterium]|nr:thymidine phosphorylase [Calditrichota bacterium]MBT7619381.1 thymidine phosphorylase [Calditrichota bacterium]
MRSIAELIIKKRDGYPLSEEELKYFIESYLSGRTPEYQMASLLMAIFFKDMETEEISALTDVFVNSGSKISFPSEYQTVDKHSTGGVGDKISLILAPIVASLGVKVPMMSGRGLGHTGGTLDKLESIPGFRTNYSAVEFRNLIDEVGMAIISQSPKLVPADYKIYALRDKTGTVESLPLITASIMSKKIAEGAQNLVIDMKVGAGAFMQNIEIAHKLAGMLKSTGERFGQKVSVVFTNMNSPLGEYVGNALEVLETIEFLKGNRLRDIDVIVIELAIEMLLLSKTCKSREDAKKLIDQTISDGSALEKFRQFVKAQGGNPDICDDVSLLPQAKEMIPIISDKTGYINSINSRAIGYALIHLGAGRKEANDKIDFGVGARLLRKIGDRLEKGETIGFVYSQDRIQGVKMASELVKHYSITERKIETEETIIDSWCTDSPDI